MSCLPTAPSLPRPACAGRAPPTHSDVVAYLKSDQGLGVAIISMIASFTITVHCVPFHYSDTIVQWQQQPQRWSEPIDAAPSTHATSLATTRSTTQLQLSPSHRSNHLPSTVAKYTVFSDIADQSAGSITMASASLASANIAGAFTASAITKSISASSANIDPVSMVTVTTAPLNTACKVGDIGLSAGHTCTPLFTSAAGALGATTAVPTASWATASAAAPVAAPVAASAAAPTTTALIVNPAGDVGRSAGQAETAVASAAVLSVASAAVPSTASAEIGRAHV